MVIWRGYASPLSKENMKITVEAKWDIGELLYLKTPDMEGNYSLCGHVIAYELWEREVLYKVQLNTGAVDIFRDFQLSENQPVKV